MDYTLKLKILTIKSLHESNTIFKLEAIKLISMKKLLLVTVLGCASLVATAQTTRTQLYEVFSGENCGPCASANPVTHALVQANASAIIALKYQVPIPSAGPICNENLVDPAARRTYYSVNAAPNARHDGTTIGNGHSINLTQALITSRQPVTSPFAMNVEHEFNANWDSIFITVQITAAQAVTSGAWVAQIALVEKNMLYTSPPGTNGETEFHNVTRKMYPTAAGTVLPTTWTNGQIQTVTIAAAVPTYIRDIAEVGIIAFVQNNTTKEVAQAAKSEPLPVPLYSTVTPPPTSFYNCNNQLTPVLDVTNLGSTTITTMVISQKVNNTTTTINWTGSLTTGSTANCTLNPMTLAAGNNTIEYKVVSMNGQPHPSAVRSTVSTKLFLQTSKVNTIAQSFLAAAFPPLNWALDNGPGAAPVGFSLAQAGANGTIRSAKVDFYNISDTEVDYLYLPRLDLTGATGNSTLNFTVAHAQYQTSNDRLRVQISTNCGTTWTDAFNKAGSALSTAPATTAAFTPSAPAQWRPETVDLTSYNGQNDLLIRFQATSNYGNNLYIDEVALSATVGIIDLSSAWGLSVYPNPVNDLAKVKLTMERAAELNFSVRNMMGQTVLVQPMGQLESGDHLLDVDFSQLDAGMYLLEIRMGNEVVHHRMVKQ